MYKILAACYPWSLVQKPFDLLAMVPGLGLYRVHLQPDGAVAQLMLLYNGGVLSAESVGPSDSFPSTIAQWTVVYGERGQN